MKKVHSNHGNSTIWVFLIDFFFLLMIVNLFLNNKTNHKTDCTEKCKNKYKINKLIK
jgi:hypothetical protein